MSRPYVNQYSFVYSLPRFYSGRCYFVDSTYGSNEYVGNKPSQPLRSINYAMSKCTDDYDDLIIVLNGYDNGNTSSETNGDDTPITIDKNGVSVLFNGRNNKVNAIASADSIFQIDANHVTLGVLPGGAIMVTAADDGTTSTVVEVKAAATDAEIFGFNTVSLDGYDEIITISATSHRCYIHDNRFVGDATDTDEGIMIGGTVDGVRIINNELISCCTGTGAIASASVHTNCIVKGNIIDSRASGKYGINFSANATGMICSNRIYVSADATGCVNGNCAEYDNLVNDAFTTGGFPSPAVGTVT